jgi:hypothetical protein
MLNPDLSIPENWGAGERAVGGLTLNHQPSSLSTHPSSPLQRIEYRRVKS